MDKLSEYQIAVLNECLDKGNCGSISLPMGAGKTLLGLVFSRMVSEGVGPVLIVVSKTLIPGWIMEIEKFMPDLVYVMFHQDNIKKIDQYRFPPDLELVLTTPETVFKSYSLGNIENRFVQTVIVNEGIFGQHNVLHYHPPTSSPYDAHDSGQRLLHSTKWGCLIVDEAQEYTKITTARCRAICSIFAGHRWLMSGTIFKEPCVENILGYYMMMNYPGMPKCLPDMEQLVRSRKYEGLLKSQIVREKAEIIIEFEEHFVNVPLSIEEAAIYTLTRSIVIDLQKRMTEYKRVHDIENTKKINGCLQSSIGLLRQCIVSPMIAISKLCLDMVNVAADSEIADMFMTKLRELNLVNYFNDAQNLTSTRLRKTIDIILSQERIVVFSAFRTTIDLLIYLLKDKKRVFVLDKDMSIPEREAVIRESQQCSDFVILVTFRMGANGLNLQHANSVMCIDSEWNYATTKQAIARVIRRGQASSLVHVYYLMSNTGVEEAIFKKHKDKVEALKELDIGAMTTKVTSYHIKDIITILEQEQNLVNFKKISLR